MCNKGSDQLNEKRSDNRKKAMKEFLLKKENQAPKMVSSEEILDDLDETPADTDLEEFEEEFLTGVVMLEKGITDYQQAHRIAVEEIMEDTDPKEAIHHKADSVKNVFSKTPGEEEIQKELLNDYKDRTAEVIEEENRFDDFDDSSLDMDPICEVSIALSQVRKSYPNLTERELLNKAIEFDLITLNTIREAKNYLQELAPRDRSSKQLLEELDSVSLLVN
ncbi:MAG: hypothetical protein PHE43_01995 [Candidatus Nanoarchaeia archaeon]|nr:hypothetical protein [Candidatus Nanoarchaeia archaeon]